MGLLLDGIIKLLSARIGVPVYMLALVSMFIGFVFLTGIVPPADSVLYRAGTMINREVWGGALLMSALIVFFGLITHNDRAISLGGILGFACWTFAGVSLVMGGYYYILFTVAVLHAVFHAYLMLAGATGKLYRITAKDILRP